MSGAWPRITVVTPSLNQAAFLPACLRSIHDQGYPNLEHLVIDGGSSDGSVDILRGHAPLLSYWCSETDSGQADAINKGLSRATGEVFAFLNSDDLYLPGSLFAVGRMFARRPDLGWLCGDTLLFGEPPHETRFIRARVPLTARELLCWDYEAPQPGMFWRRSLVRGGFDPRWRYCFDHAIYLRLVLEGVRCERLDLPVAAYRLHGSSKTVFEADSFDAEFDEVAREFEPLVSWPLRRRSRALRQLRASHSAADRGDRAAARKLVLAALATWPFEVRRRPFWGSLRAALTL